MTPPREESKPLEVYSPRTRTIVAMKPHSGEVEMDLISEASAPPGNSQERLLKMGLSLDRPF